MKIKLCSDLHLEFSTITLPNTEQADVLVLAGDILIADDLHKHADTEYSDRMGNRQRSAVDYRRFMEHVSSAYSHVVVIAGNHEFYSGDFHSGVDVLREEYSKFSNIHFLEHEYVTIDGVVFVGGTLWTDMNRSDPLTMASISSTMNDYRSIRNDYHSYRRLMPVDTVRRHQDTLKYIKQIAEEDAARNIVVVSHHSPSHMSIADAYKSDRITNGAYHSDLSEFILDHPNIVYWFHGHTHTPFDYTIGNTRVVCNPRGYESESYNEATGWNQQLILEI